MALDFEQQRTLGIMAGTMAQWLRDNPDAADNVDENGFSDADEVGMYALATGFLRMYKECLDAGIITPPQIPPKTIQ